MQAHLSCRRWTRKIDVRWRKIIDWKEEGGRKNAVDEEEDQQGMKKRAEGFVEV